MSDRAKLEFHRFDYASFFAFFAYATSSVVVPVSLIQIADSLRFPLADGGMGAGGGLELARSLTMTALMLISGFIAARYGLRKSLGGAVFIMGLGNLLGALSGSYWVMFASILLAGSGEGVMEALGTPFVQKLHTEHTSQYMNFAHSFWSIGVTVTTVSAGLALMMGVSWRIIVFTAFLVAMIPTVLLLLPQKKGHEYPEKKETQSIGNVCRQAAAIMKTPRFWLFFGLMFVAGGAEYCLTFWLSSFLQLTMKTSAFFGGLATATFALGMVTGRMGWGIFVPQERLGKSLLICSLVGTVLSCIVPSLHPDLPIGRTGVLVVLFVLLYLIGITVAPLWPSLQTYAVSRLPKKLDETMIFVLLSCAGVPGCGCFTLFMGLIGDACGNLNTAYFLVPFCQLVLVVALLIETKRRHTEHYADK